MPCQHLRPVGELMPCQHLGPVGGVKKGIPMVNQRKPPGGEGLGFRVGSLGEGFGLRASGGRGL